MLFPKGQVLMVCDGSKTATARKPNFKVSLGARKFLNNFKFGYFAEANICDIERDVHISSFDDKLAQELGYATVGDYMSHNWNNEYETRTIIRWDAIDIRWDVVERLGVI